MDQPKLPFSIVAIATSAGGVKALSDLVTTLPARFPIPILIVQHLAPDRPSLMPQILARHTNLHVKQVVDHEMLDGGTVYLAPPGSHLLVDKYGKAELTQTPRVHSVRPSANRLFESVAQYFGEHAIAVVLTGTGSDGADGVVAIKRSGGTVIAQDPESSEFPGMPHAAVMTGQVDFILPLNQIVAALTRLVMPGDARNNLKV